MLQSVLVLKITHLIYLKYLLSRMSSPQICLASKYLFFVTSFVQSGPISIQSIRSSLNASIKCTTLSIAIYKNLC